MARVSEKEEHNESLTWWLEAEQPFVQQSQTSMTRPTS